MDVNIDYTIMWMTRGGNAQSITFTNVAGTHELDFDDCERVARKCGYPGHSGTKLDYFKDDVRRWFAIDPPHQP